MITLKGEKIVAEDLAALLEAVEVRVLKGVLKASKGNVAKTARVLSVSRRTVYFMMRRHGIELGLGRH